MKKLLLALLISTCMAIPSASAVVMFGGNRTATSLDCVDCVGAGDIDLTDDYAWTGTHTFAVDTGIGVAAPEVRLHVVDADNSGSVAFNAGTVLAIEDSGNAYVEFSSGDAMAQGFLFSDTNGIRGQLIYSLDSLLFSFTTQGQNRLKLGATEAVFNESGVDTDFRIETDTEANAFVIDAGAETITFNIPLTVNDPITSTGTVEGATLTEGGNAVYNATDIPGGELGGTWASPTIDDNVTTTGWAMGTMTATAIGIGGAPTNEFDIIDPSYSAGMSITADDNAVITIAADSGGDEDRDAKLVWNEGAADKYAMGFDGSSGLLTLSQGAALGTTNVFTVSGQDVNFYADVTVEGGFDTTTAGVPLTVQNTTDAASNQVGKFHAGNRTTAANSDEGYLSFFGDDDTEVQTEWGRLTWLVEDVQTASLDTNLQFEVWHGGVQTIGAQIDGAQLLIPDDLGHLGDADTVMRWSAGGDAVSFIIGGLTMLTLTEAGTDIATFGATVKATGYESSDGSAGITGATCSAWKNGLCTSA